MSPEAIRIRITPREPHERLGNSREAFWSAVRSEAESNQTIASSEAKLCREFGIELRRALLRELAEPLRTLDSELFPGGLRDFEHWMFRFMNGPVSEKDWYRYQGFEVFSRFLEQRQQVLRESPSFQEVQERLAAAAGVTFLARIAGYSSLDVNLSVGSFTQVARAFANDFDSFRVFLEAFVPVAFAGVFSEYTADRLEFAVMIPQSVESAFHAVGNGAPGLQVTPSASVSRPVSDGGARERAEWLWRLANGSLLVPFLLALLVMYLGMRMLTEIRSNQYEAVRPILEHQLKLLEEDRLRILGTKDQQAQTPTPPGQEE